MISKMYNIITTKQGEERQKDVDNIVIPKMTFFKNFLGSKDFLLGYLTIADFIGYNVLCGIKSNFEEDVYAKFKDTFDPYMKRFEELPKIKEYIKSDRYLAWKKM